MIIEVYRSLLKLPRFKGRDRIITLYRSLFLKPKQFALLHSLRFEPDPYEWLQSELLRHGYTEPLTSKLYGQLLRAEDSYIDVGAHVGFHTLLARHYVGPEGQVVAIEPQPYNCNKILANWNANGFENIYLYVAAAGDREEFVALHAQSATDTARLSLELGGVSDRAQLFQVPVRRLDAVMRERDIERVRLLKIDVEGFELSVINGLGSRLANVDHLIVELLDAGSEMSSNTSAVLERLRAASFQLKTVTGEPWDERSPLPENNLLASRHDVSIAKPST